MSTWQWCTTAPNPRHPGTGVDAGQRGWRLHLVDVDAGPVMRPSIWGGGPRNVSPALCGIRPRHGWALDLFIDAACDRCAAAEARRGLDIPLP